MYRGVRPVVGALLTTAFVVVTWAAGPKATEGPRDLIDKAQNLILQKERGAAIQLLVGALRRESSKSSTAKELRSSLASISTVFFTDKTQQLYELALTLRRTDLGQAQARLEEALRLEPRNSLLVAENARVSLLRGECSSVREQLRIAKDRNPYDELILLALAQAALCLRDIPDYTSVRSLADPRSGPYVREWTALEVERALVEKSATRAREGIDAISKLDADHPEISFWQFSLEKNEEKRKALGLKYVQRCKSLTLSVARRYIQEVSLCRRVAEMEEVLSGKSELPPPL